ncbi:MAG: NADH-quinone oxidoreductase subunit NuoH [Cyanobacteria bacterium]|nr:NADH-quinone oxidoreductase subunit NuoH [Cyanobacteriota bacterium]
MVPAWLTQLLQALHLSIGPELSLVLWGIILFTGIAILGQAAVIFMVLMERKVLAWLTQRKGPNRVGPWGLLQTLADGVKLLFKEDIMTTGQDKLLFTIAPAIFFLPVFVLYALIPFTDKLLAIPLPTGALFVFALSSISVVGIVLAGWASNNKYSLLGGMRSAAQAISYEIPLVLSVLAVVLYTGTMNIQEILTAQNAPFWKWFGIWLTPVSFLIFLISSIAEVNRIPFDLPEAESELVSGYNTEYTGMKFALFFLAEYAALFAMSALTVIFFFGGYYSPIGGTLCHTFGWDRAFESAVNLPGLGQLMQQFEMITWGLLKTYIFIFIAMWLRGTLPRLKPDQLMGFSWKFLIPLSLINIFMVALERQWQDTNEVVYGYLWAFVLVFGIGGFCWTMSRFFTRKLQARFQS